ncbi:hypothetical protein P886_2027 [Alteromonadaceae bacterium 2753L.S.0a.02]|nr:hypothetical protein P886_2027 [Alteromonadaceae bacterium 2753L.S.0a.02]
MSALKVEGERTNQSIVSTVTTGAKNFGSIFTNPNVQAASNNQVTVLAVGGLIVVAGVVLYAATSKKRGR